MGGLGASGLALVGFHIFFFCGGDTMMPATLVVFLPHATPTHWQLTSYNTEPLGNTENGQKIPKWGWGQNQQQQKDRNHELTVLMMQEKEAERLPESEGALLGPSTVPTRDLTKASSCHFTHQTAEQLPKSKRAQKPD